MSCLPHLGEAEGNKIEANRSVFLVVGLGYFTQQRAFLDLKAFILKATLCLCAQLLWGGRWWLIGLSPCAPTGEVHMPSGKTATPEIVDNKDGTVTVRYAPTEVGLHEMHIKYMGSHIPGESGLVP